MGGGYVCLGVGVGEPVIPVVGVIAGVSVGIGASVGVGVGVAVAQALLKVSQASWLILRCLPSGPMQSTVGVIGWLALEVLDKFESVPDESDLPGTGLSVGDGVSVGCGAAVGVIDGLADLLDAL